MGNRSNTGKFVSGQSGNPSGRPKKSFITTEIMTKADKLVNPEKRPDDLKKEVDWIPFGSNNLFPQALAVLNRRSPVQRAIINSKTIYTTGKGYTTDDTKLLDYISNVNGRGESLTTVAQKLFLDQYIFGNSYLEIVRGEGFISLFHKDASKARVKKSGDAILFHSDWDKLNGNHGTSQKEKENIIEIPLYPKFKNVKGQLRSVMHFKSYEPEFNYYGVPDYIAAIDAAGIGYKTNKWNISRLENGFQSSGILLVSGDMSVDDANKLKEKFKEEFTGEENQGKIMFIAKNLGGETETTFTPINSGNDGDWMDLHRQSTNDLVIAHGWFPALAGIETAGKLGNSQEIRNAYQIALNTVIQKEQVFLTHGFMRVLKDAGFNTDDLHIVNKPPVNMIDLIDMNMVVMKGEARSLAGLQVDDTDPRMKEFIKKDNGATDKPTGGN